MVYGFRCSQHRTPPPGDKPAPVWEVQLCLPFSSLLCYSGAIIAELVMVKGAGEEGRSPMTLSLPPSPVAGARGPKGISISSLPLPANSRSPFSSSAPQQCSASMVGRRMVGRLRAPQRCPHPNPQNLWMSPYNSKIDFVDVIISRTVSWGDYPGLSWWAQYHHKGLYQREAGRSDWEKTWLQKQRSEWYRARNQRMQVGSRSEKRPRNGFSPRASRKSQPCQYLGFSQMRMILDFWLLELWDNKCVLLKVCSNLS